MIWWIAIEMVTEEEQRIRERAYFIWEQEGRPDGRGLDHWLQAEYAIKDQKIAAVGRQALVRCPYCVNQRGSGTRDQRPIETHTGG
jgi:hypothetical protein